MLWPQNIHTRNLITKKNSCGSKIPFPPPPHNVSNGPSLRSCRRWQPVGDRGGGGKNFQLSVKGMLPGQTDGNSWKGRTIHITSLLYNTKHVRSPNWPGNHRIHTADKKRAIPRNKMTLWFRLLIIMFVLKEHYITIILLSINHRHTDPRMFYIFFCVFFSLSLSYIYFHTLYTSLLS